MPEIPQDELTDREKSIQARAFGDGWWAGYELGMLAGQEEMRERAAELCDSLQTDSSKPPYYRPLNEPEDCAEQIRALEIKLPDLPIASEDHQA